MSYIDIRATFHNTEHGFAFTRCLMARTVEQALEEVASMPHKAVQIFAMQNNLPLTLWTNK